MSRYAVTYSKEQVDLIAYIVKEPYGYELRVKKDNGSDKFLHAGHCTCDEILKRSITAKWEKYTGKEKDIIWIAKGV